MIRNRYLTIVPIAFAMGCATHDKSAGAGATIGALGGAALGGIADPGKNGELRTRNVFIGAAFGTVAGAAIGSSLYKQIDESKKEAFEAGKKAAPAEGAAPKLTPAKIEARWIEGRIQGNRYVDSHWEYVILEPARWEDGGSK